jgi:hypothetical protein
MREEYAKARNLYGQVPLKWDPISCKGNRGSSSSRSRGSLSDNIGIDLAVKKDRPVGLAQLRGELVQVLQRADGRGRETEAQHLMKRVNGPSRRLPAARQRLGSRRESQHSLNFFVAHNRCDFPFHVLQRDFMMFLVIRNNAICG